MTARSKSILLLLATLLIGMVLGALINARLAEQRLERIAFLRSSRGFVRFWEEAVEPQDEAQREAIEAVLEQAGRRLAEHMRTTSGEMQDIIDSTKTELDALLTPEQRARLERRMQRRRQNRFEDRRPERFEERRGPPGRGGGPPGGPPRQRPPQR
ncbi:MAG: hypothetical protein ACR2GR_04935 [Rhodothermales bacterium]